MTKDEAIRTAGAAQHAAVKALAEYDLDSPEELAATDTAESTWQTAIALGATPDEIRAAARQS